MTKSILPFIFIFIMHILSKVNGKVLPLYSVDQSSTEIKADLITTLENNYLTAFLEILNIADLTDLLKNKGPFTVFVPNNKAFESLEPIVLQALKEKSLVLETLLLSHIVPGNFALSSLTDGRRLKSRSGISLLVNSKENFTINAVSVVKSDVIASNGVIHIIDEFVHWSYSDSAEILESSDEKYLENLEIFEHSNSIDSDIISQLRDKKLSKFLDLIENAGVENTFTNRKGYPITVFVPDNEAFNFFDGKDLSPEDLQSFVFAHILFGEKKSRDLVNDEILQTIGGSTLIIQTKPKFTVNGHLVLDQIYASNGVIYVVNTLLVSPPKSALPQWAREYLPPPLKSDLDDSSTSDDSVNHLCDKLKTIGLSTAHDLIIKAGLGQKLLEKGPLTMFVPNNEAFARLESAQYDIQLETLLLNHLINQRLTSADFKDQDVIKSLGGAIHTLEIKSRPRSDARELLVSGVSIIKADIIWTNGVIHVLDQVIHQS